MCGIVFIRPEWVTVCLTAAYVLISLLTLLTIKRQGDLAHDTLVSTFRPRLSLRRLALQPEIASELRNAESLTVNIVIHNCGGTPARIEDGPIRFYWDRKGQTAGLKSLRIASETWSCNP